VPYRVDIPDAGADVFDRLVELGALDAERSHDGTIAALVPDSVAPSQVAKALGLRDVAVSSAIGRDDDSVWVLHPRPIEVGGIRLVPVGGPTQVGPHGDDGPAEAGPHVLRVIDSGAFGTGLHPTTGLCLEAIRECVTRNRPASLLDVGTGSGVLALAALTLGVPAALGIDVDGGALRVAAENARLNALDDRLQLHHGGPEVVAGAWPLVVANVLAAPLIAMAPLLVRRLDHAGHLILSGIPVGVERDVDQAYRRLGVARVSSASRAGWVALILQATW
jgi:ribosomal protein L11 methyltransferase